MSEHSSAMTTIRGSPIRCRILGALTLALAFALAGPAAAQVPDASRGRALYENHCIACHTDRVHARPNRIALTRDEVRVIVDHWQRQQALAWSPQDTEDVVEFLGRSRYHFAPVTGQLGRP